MFKKTHLGIKIVWNMGIGTIKMELIIFILDKCPGTGDPVVTNEI